MVERDRFSAPARRQRLMTIADLLLRSLLLYALMSTAGRHFWLVGATYLWLEARLGDIISGVRRRVDLEQARWDAAVEAVAELDVRVAELEARARTIARWGNGAPRDDAADREIRRARLREAERLRALLPEELR